MLDVRNRNREAGIPDMETGESHEPAEYFAQVGFFSVLALLGRSAPDHDWSLDGGDEKDHEDFVAARRLDHQRISDWMRKASIRPIQNSDGILFAGMRIGWPDRIPALKVWSGRQTLANIVKSRQKAIPEEVADVLAVKAPIKGASGMYAPCASTALEDGFSVNQLGMLRYTPVGLELLAIVGLEELPITVWPDGSLSYVASDLTYRFRIEKRGDYYRRWSRANRNP